MSEDEDEDKWVVPDGYLSASEAESDYDPDTCYIQKGDDMIR